MSHLLLKMPPGELARSRRVWRPSRTPITDQETFRQTPVSDMFSLTTLKRMGKELRRSDAQLRSSGERAANALTLIGATTVADILALPYETIASASGMGPTSMALVLDVLCLFGQTIQGTPADLYTRATKFQRKGSDFAPLFR